MQNKLKLKKFRQWDGEVWLNYINAPMEGYDSGGIVKPTIPPINKQVPIEAAPDESGNPNIPYSDPTLEGLDLASLSCQDLSNLLSYANSMYTTMGDTIIQSYYQQKASVINKFYTIRNCRVGSDVIPPIQTNPTVPTTSEPPQTTPPVVPTDDTPIKAPPVTYTPSPDPGIPSTPPVVTMQTDPIIGTPIVNDPYAYGPGETGPVGTTSVTAPTLTEKSTTTTTGATSTGGGSIGGGGGAGGGGGSTTAAKPKSPDFKKDWYWWLLVAAVVGFSMYKGRNTSIPAAKIAA